MHSAAQSKQKAQDEENMKKYQEEIQKKFEIPHEDPPTDPEQMEEYLLKRMKLLEVIDSYLAKVESSERSLQELTFGLLLTRSRTIPNLRA